MDRVILHSDMNNFYASVELLYHPELKGRPLAVGGDPEARHGIVLAKDELAKKTGVKTGMALWQAREVCPDIQIVRPHMDRYIRFSKLARQIYADYTDLEEPFGIDESWLDVTASISLMGDGFRIASKINERVKKELGVTVSIGVSWNKIFAKLGSDLKKPDAVTCIGREDFREKIWPLPAGELLYVGPATSRKLSSHGIRTIGELAAADPDYLRCRFGKMGLVLKAFANGCDMTPVSRMGDEPVVKSIGNSTTAPRDLLDDEDVKIVVYMLAESVSTRLREQRLMCRTVEICVRDSSLFHITRQRKLPSPAHTTGEIAREAMRLFREHCRFERPVRSIGVRAADLCVEESPVQLCLFENTERREKELRAERAADEIRRRFGRQSVMRGLMLKDRLLSGTNIREAAAVHPHGYMEYGNRTGIGA